MVIVHLNIDHVTFTYAKRPLRAQKAVSIASLFLNISFSKLKMHLVRACKLFSIGVFAKLCVFAILVCTICVVTNYM